MRADELRAISLFGGLADDQLAELAEGGTEVRIEPGVDLFREGEHADFWWVLIDGAVDLLRHIGVPLGVRRPVGMGAVRRRPGYLRAGALIAAMVILVIVPTVLLAADAVAAGPGRSPATACGNIAPE